MLIDRVTERAHRLALTQAISQLNGVEHRVLALLWQLAERWGHVTPRGTAMPLTLRHRVLAQQDGARRPTVSTAISELAHAGTIERRPAGGWRSSASQSAIPRRPRAARSACDGPLPTGRTGTQSPARPCRRSTAASRRWTAGRARSDPRWSGAAVAASAPQQAGGMRAHLPGEPSLLAPAPAPPCGRREGCGALVPAEGLEIPGAGCVDIANSSDHEERYADGLSPAPWRGGACTSDGAVVSRVDHRDTPVPKSTTRRRVRPARTSSRGRHRAARGGRGRDGRRDGGHRRTSTAGIEEAGPGVRVHASTPPAAPQRRPLPALTATIAVNATRAGTNRRRSRVDRHNRTRPLDAGVDVRSGAGDDSIRIADALTDAVTIESGPGADTVVGGPGHGGDRVGRRRRLRPPRSRRRHRRPRRGGRHRDPGRRLRPGRISSSGSRTPEHQSATAASMSSSESTNVSRTSGSNWAAALAQHHARRRRRPEAPTR